MSNSGSEIEHSASINTSIRNSRAASAMSPAIGRSPIFQNRKLDNSPPGLLVGRRKIISCRVLLQVPTKRRVPRPSNARAKYKMGAPLFAFFAKGGHDAACSADFDFVEDLMVQTVSYPPLQRTQGRATHSRGSFGNQGPDHPAAGYSCDTSAKRHASIIYNRARDSPNHNASSFFVPCSLRRRRSS